MLQVCESSYASQNLNFSKKSNLKSILLENSKSWTDKKIIILNLINIRMSSFDIIYDMEKYKRLFLLIRKCVCVCLSFSWNTPSNSTISSFSTNSSLFYPNSSEISLYLRRILNHLFGCEMLSMFPPPNDNFNHILSFMIENSAGCLDVFFLSIFN